MIYINGRFLGKKPSGVPLFALQVVKCLDIQENNNKFEILIDKSIKSFYPFKYLKIKRIGLFKGNLWEQISLYRFMRKNRNDKLLNLCNSSPVFLSSYITIHDIGLFKNKGYKSKLFTLWYSFMFKKTIKNAIKIFTVSEFSKNEICSYYKISKERVAVVYSSYNIDNFNETNILEKLKINKDNYYLSVGSYLPHKNFDILIDYAKNHSDFILVLNIDKTINNLPNNIIITKDLSQDDLGTLYKNAYAYIQISQYEGFGVPPLEAIKCGCKRIILSDIPVFKEIYKDVPSYISIINSLDTIPKISEITKEKKEEILTKYTWNITTNIIKENID